MVTSLDVGFRKPHPAFFEAVLVEAGCAPAECVMIGNSEPNDIQPAIALGYAGGPRGKGGAAAAIKRH